MTASILFILSALEMVSVASNPFQEKKEAPPPKTKQVEVDLSDLSGYYTCKGEEAGGKKYTGVVSLMKKNEIYIVSWVVGGGSTFSGIGIRQGNNLTASWSINTERGIVKGVNLYRIEMAKEGPRLVGRWSSLPGPGVQQSETLTFLKKMDSDEE